MEAELASKTFCFNYKSTVDNIQKEKGLFQNDFNYFAICIGYKYLILRIRNDGHNSIVCIVTCYELDSPGIESQ